MDLEQEVTRARGFEWRLGMCEEYLGCFTETYYNSKEPAPNLYLRDTDGNCIKASEARLDLYCVANTGYLLAMFGDRIVTVRFRVKGTELTTVRLPQTGLTFPVGKGETVNHALARALLSL